jgi:hypothetical protein
MLGDSNIVRLISEAINEFVPPGRHGFRHGHGKIDAGFPLCARVGDIYQNDGCAASAKIIAQRASGGDHLLARERCERHTDYALLKVDQYQRRALRIDLDLGHRYFLGSYRYG